MSDFLCSTYDMDVVCLHCYTGGHNKFYIYWIERLPNDKYTVLAAWGKVSNPKAQAQNEQYQGVNLSTARHHIAALVAARERKGYVNVMDDDYRGDELFPNITGGMYHAILRKVTTHNLNSALNYDPIVPAPTPARRAIHPAARRAPVTPVPVAAAGPYRSRRTLEI